MRIHLPEFRRQGAVAGQRAVVQGLFEHSKLLENQFVAIVMLYLQ